jgi:hypothetical protein
MHGSRHARKQPMHRRGKIYISVPRDIDVSSSERRNTDLWIGEQVTEEAVNAPPPMMASFAQAGAGGGGGFPAATAGGGPSMGGAGGAAMGGAGGPAMGGGMGGMGGGGGTPGGGGNMFARQARTGARSRYVDTLNPSSNANDSPAPQVRFWFILGLFLIYSA